MRKEKPITARSPKLAAFKTERTLRIWLHDEYWEERKTLEEIGEHLDISASRVRELLVKFHICTRSRGQRSNKY